MKFYSKRGAQTIALLCVALLGACGGGGGDSNLTAAPARSAPTPIASMPPIAAPETPVPAPGTTPVVKASSARFVSTAPTVKNGNYGASAGLTYDFGRLMVSSDKEDSFFHPAGVPRPGVYLTRIAGWVRYPQPAAQTSAPARYPVVVFLHGMHDAGVDNFRGYDYLSESLVTNGYVVISIDANDINAAQDGLYEYNSGSRAQLVLRTLDKFFADGHSTHPVYPALAGKLDPDRIGIMGHSRGGEGVADVVSMNGRRTGVTLEDVRQSATVLTDDAEYGESLFSRIGATPTMFYQRLAAALIWNSASEIANAVKLETGRPLYPELAMKLRTDGADRTGVSDDVFAQELRDAGVDLAPGQRDAVPPPTYTFKAMLALAPTDNVHVASLPNVPMATLIPACDGDVWSYDGARLYDNNRFGIPGNTAPRYQLVVRGANHNWFNTTWTYATPEIPAPDVPTQDDANARNDDDLYCQIHSDASDAVAATPKESIRLSAAEQRKLGVFLMNSFMRFFVGGEQQFGAYWTGSSQIPADSCPGGTTTCDARVLLTAQRPRGERTRVTHFDLFQPSAGINTVLNPNGSTSLYSGMTDAIDCDSFETSPYRCWPVVTGSRGQSIVESDKYGAYEYTRLLSTADHMQLMWSAPGASIVTDLAGTRAAGDDTLTFRIANKDWAAQEVQVTLADGIHPVMTVNASAYTDALYTQLADPAAAAMTTNRMLLNMVSIPLAAFEGIDPAQLKTLTLTFPKDSGTVAFTDLQFQNLNRKSAEVTQP